MAILSSDKTYVTVEKGDTLSQIAQTYSAQSGGKTYQQLAALNNISNANLIFINQKIYLTKSSSGGSSKSNNSNKPTINQFGVQSNNEGTLFATWTWDWSNTANYEVKWEYDTGDSVWFIGNKGTTDDKQSTYSIPSNAKKVRFRVKPISKTYKPNGSDKEVSYWTAEWSNAQTWTDSTPLTTPSVPNVEITDYTLTATLDNININGATYIYFQVVKNNSKNVFKYGDVEIISRHVSFSCAVDAGSEYKVRCYAHSKKGGGDKSEWSDYSSNTSTMPAAVSKAPTVRATSETSVYLEWGSVATAKTYEIEYAEKKEYFDGSDQTTTKTGIESNHFEISGLESGRTYFFRVRAVNDKGSSAWSGTSSVIIGTDPAAPTTWSSTTTVVVGEECVLYWVHNSEDGSSQTYAELELTINGTKLSAVTIKNSTDKELKDKTSSCIIDTNSGYLRWTEDKVNKELYLGTKFQEGVKIQWRVRTSGITKVYGDWSIERTVDIYVRPNLELAMTTSDAEPISILSSFPFFISALPSPNTQAPIGYHLSIVSNEVYETTDSIGNFKMVNAGEQVYSKYFDIKQDLLVELSAGNIDLANNVRYTVTCTVSMNSGLTATDSKEFTVGWIEEEYTPNAEVGIDASTLTASIRPYCNDRSLEYRQVAVTDDSYIVTDTVLDSVYGEVVENVLTATGEQVYKGVTADSVTELYYCEVETITPVTDVYLSVYRREFDGSFTELATLLDGAKNIAVTDPHPALDYARYRIVATSKDTGAVSYYDLPGVPVNGAAVILQWDEAWSNFDASEAAQLAEPEWSGSMLKLPYNIDVSDSTDPEVEIVKYIGRNHPVAYYGTQRGQKASWSVVIDKSDEETLYGLRRLAMWMGDVYVREPSGSGYWANIKVSFSQKHSDLTIPVSLDVTRVEGGA